VVEWLKLLSSHIPRGTKPSINDGGVDERGNGDEVNVLEDGGNIDTDGGEDEKWDGIGDGDGDGDGVCVLGDDEASIEREDGEDEK